MYTANNAQVDHKISLFSYLLTFWKYLSCNSSKFAPRNSEDVFGRCGRNSFGDSTAQTVSNFSHIGLYFQMKKTWLFYWLIFAMSTSTTWLSILEKNSLVRMQSHQDKFSSECKWVCRQIETCLHSDMIASWWLLPRNMARYISVYTCLYTVYDRAYDTIGLYSRRV